MMSSFFKLLALVSLLFFSLATALAEGEAATFFSFAPEIENLSHRDLTFRQYSEDVRRARMALAREPTEEQLIEMISFYKYRAKTGDDLLAIAARTSVPYESIATLNRIGNAGDLIEGKMLILPSMPGIYMPLKPENSFEELLAADIADSADEGIRIGGGSFLLLPGRQLSGTTRTFFLVRAMRFPIPEGVLTSAFGNRINPVTGTKAFHSGIDLAAPHGTPVYACAAGTVTEISYSELYGNYIIIEHPGGRESLYGHLSEIKVSLNESVLIGAVIGSVGSTGQSTGPHLHFEIHENGIPRNPEGLIR